MAVCAAMREARGEFVVEGIGERGKVNVAVAVVVAAPAAGEREDGGVTDPELLPSAGGAGRSSRCGCVIVFFARADVNEFRYNRLELERTSIYPFFETLHRPLLFVDTLFDIASLYGRTRLSSKY